MQNLGREKPIDPSVRDTRRQVDRLVAEVDRSSMSGGIDPVLHPGFVLESLNLCNVFHWNAFARVAGIPAPTPEVIEAVKDVFRQRARLG